MSTDDRRGDAADPEATVADLLTYAELLTTPRLAQFYVYVLRNGPVAVEPVMDALEMPHSTAYKYVGDLEDLGILTRHDDAPTRVSVDPLRLRVDTDEGEVLVTPVLVDAIARQLDTEDIRVFVERQGVAKLAAALHYARRVRAGELTQRTAATRLDVHPVEGMTILTALQAVLDDAPAEEVAPTPDPDADPDLDA